MRQYALIREKPEYANDPTATLKALDIKDEKFIFLGEIPNMEGHCVIIGFGSGKVHCGFHIDRFEEVEDNEI